MLWLVGLAAIAAGAVLAILSGTGLLDLSRLFGPLDDALSEAKAQALVDEVRREKAAKGANDKSRTGDG
jgi:hypothetical protein